MSAVPTSTIAAIRSLGPDQEPRRRRRTPSHAVLALNITAMIDVVFLLMTYFLLTAQFTRREESIPHALPAHLSGRATDREPDPFSLPPTPVVIVVRSSGDGPADFSLSTDSPLLSGTLTAEDLRRGAGDRRDDFASDQRFIIRAAPDVRWEHALAAFNALRRAGWTSIQFANPMP